MSPTQPMMPLTETADPTASDAAAIEQGPGPVPR